MWYFISSISSLIIGIFLGWLITRKNKKLGGTSPRPPSDINIDELYDEIEANIKDNIERDKTIEKLKERLGK